MVFIKIFQKGFNYSQDGPGNRLVYHMQGCNFRCKWCSNPESMENVCKTTVNYSPEEIADEAKRCKMMFFDGGGVTFTGGEPTVQFEELFNTLHLLKKNEIHTAIETNGSCGRLTELLQFVDFLIIDVKHVDMEQHKQWTGADNLQTLNNIAEITKIGRQVLIRIPLIHGFNSGAHKEFASFFKNLDTQNAAFELLPYHEYGKDKWERPYEIENGFVSKQEIDNFKEEFYKNGLKLVIT
ncbi:radical SAM protein [Congzhengia minquanensis]|uniref:radical SAM protein n=1 Tax=Congzhengia minquanensis TaxID=2763657 RepID=UPI0024B5A598|nr:radical SAM protein [Congzhengia minquanensis]